MIARRRAVLLLPALLGVARCSRGGDPPPPAVLELAISAGADQNPGENGRPASVAVRLYQLKASAAFEGADYYALAEREKATLADDGAGTEEFVLSPGENRTVTRQLKPGVQFVGVVAAFRDVDRAGWRAVQPVAVNGTTKLSLRVAETKIILAHG